MSQVVILFAAGLSTISALAAHSLAPGPAASGMVHPQYSDYEGFVQQLGESTHYSQAVRIGDSIECSGQGGWDPATGAIPEDLATELEQIFKNVELNLKVGGASLFDYGSITCISVGHLHTQAGISRKQKLTEPIVARLSCWLSSCEVLR